MLIFKYLLFSRIDTIEVQQWSMYSSLIAKKIGIVFFMLVWLKRIICQRQIYLFFRYISVYKDYFYRYMTFGIKKATFGTSFLIIFGYEVRWAYLANLIE